MDNQTRTKQLKVSVVMPTYNESESVVEAMERITKNVGEQLHEIIIVDDDSPDKTWKVVEEQHNPKWRIIRRLHEKGLASALAMGVKEATGDIIVWRDCDLGIPPEDTTKLLAKIDEYDVVVGSRYVEGGKDTRSKLRTPLSVGINLFAGLILGFHVKDYTSGFAAVRKEVFNKVAFPGTGFGEYFIEFIYRCAKNNFRITEVGYTYSERDRGKSKTSGLFTLFKLGIQYALRVIKIRFT